jgi:hypothetical protein
MEQQTEITNRVANSGLITFNLEDMRPEGERVLLDIKDQLFEGLILKEKDFRAFIKDNDWSIYNNKYVAITCTADAIIPVWAYMLVAIALQPYAAKVVFGSVDELETTIFSDVFKSIDWNVYNDSKVVLKGCSNVLIPTAVYVEATVQLQKRVKSLSFGEPCSTVPLFKKKK